MSIFRFLAVLVMSLLLSSAAMAAQRQPASVELSQPIVPNAKVTYLDLARQFVPDLKEDGTGSDNSKLAGIRHVGGPDGGATIRDIRLSIIQRIDLPGERRALILFDLGPAEDAAQSVTILGFYDVSTAPRLLDAMDVGTDLRTSFAEPYLLPLSSEVTVGFVGSWHLNSGEEFVSTSLIGIWNGKLHAVDTISLRNWEWCNTFVKHRLEFSKGVGVTLDAVMNVSSKRHGSCDDDSGSAESKRYAVRYQWSEQAQTLMPDTDALKAVLASEEAEDQ